VVSAVPRSGLTVDEEIAMTGGLEAYRATSFAPRVGHAVIFLHDTLHAGAAVSAGTKHVLRTDIVYQYCSDPENDDAREHKDGDSVIRKTIACGSDNDDYSTDEHECREAFVEAQRCLVLGQDIECSKWFQRANSLRRAAGRKLHADSTTLSANKTIGSTVCGGDRRRVVLVDVLNIGLPGSLVLAFGDLGDQWAVRCTSHACRDIEAIYQRQKWARGNLLGVDDNTHDVKGVPKRTFQKLFTPAVKSASGTTAVFEFPDARFVKAHLDACLRVLAMYTCFMFGTTPGSDTFVAEYDSQRRIVKRGSLACLLTAAFFRLPCHGTLLHLDAIDVDDDDDAGDDDGVVGDGKNKRKRKCVTTEGERKEERVSIVDEDVDENDVDSENNNDDDTFPPKSIPHSRGTLTPHKDAVQLSFATTVGVSDSGARLKEAFLESVDRIWARQELGVHDWNAHVVAEAATNKPVKHSYSVHYRECHTTLPDNVNFEKHFIQVRPSRSDPKTCR
jgi:hypothetical protein